MKTVALVLLAVSALSADAGASIADASNEGAANPIRRVVTLLQKMAKKVQEEGEKEEELYKKFNCYCKNSGGELAAAIAQSDAKVPQVQSDIEQGEAELQRLKTDIGSHQDDRRAAKSAMADATAQREKEHKAFVAESDEYKSYVSSLASAITAIEKGMGGGFLQTNMGAVLKQAVLNDASVTDFDRQSVLAFLSNGASESTEYIPKSGEITGILKTMQEDFQKSLDDITKVETDDVSVYEELVAAKSKQVAALGASIEKKTGRVGELQVEIVNMKNELSDTEAALVADKKFAEELEKSCDSKQADWEQRQKTRAEELVAIHDTIKVLNDDEALDLFKKTLPSPSLLQMEASKKQMQQKALALIKNVKRTFPQGRPELNFMALALSGRKVDFTSVLKMIDNMVALLAQEQADDDSKKEYCSKQIDATEDKAKVLGKTVEDLEAAIADKEEAIATLKSELKELTAGIAELDKSVAEATEQRKKENEEFVELMASDKAAKELLEYAKNRLNKFYNPSLYRAPPKREMTEAERISVNMGGTLSPTPAPGGIAGTGISAFVQISLHRAAPEPPPATWDAYATKSEETTGVIGMIDLLVRDLDKEMTEAQTEEKNAQADYEATMNDAAKKRAADLKSLAGKEKSKADYEEDRTTDEQDKASTAKELMATKQYEMQLHQECDWLIQNFDLRKQARADETDALKQAKAVLSGADFALMQSKTVGRHLRGQ